MGRKEEDAVLHKLHKTEQRFWWQSLQAQQPLLLSRRGCVLYQGKVLFIFFFKWLHPRFICVCFYPWLSFLARGGKREPVSNPLSSSFSSPKSLLSLLKP